MNTEIIIAIIGAVATVFAAWISAKPKIKGGMSAPIKWLRTVLVFVGGSLLTLIIITVFQIINAYWPPVPSGTIIAFAGSVEKIPSGWLLCDGKSLKVAEYDDLFKAIGHSWGNEDNDKATFNLPDLRGIFLRGASLSLNNDKGVDARYAIKPGGAEKNNVGSYQDEGTRAPLNPFISTTPVDKKPYIFTAAWPTDQDGTALGRGASDYRQVQLGLAEHKHKISRDGCGGDNETRPSNAYVLYIIKS